MRKGTNKLTGLIKAVKIIKKSTMNNEERDRLINEVEILKKIVFLLKKGPSQYYKNIRIL